MKRVQLLFAVMMVIFAMTSCDKVKEPFVNEVEVSSKSIILIEDYTGVKCVNCPAAAELAHKIQETYPENVLVLGVHAGDLAMPLDPNQDFRTEAGTAWWNYFEFAANPIGTINRTKNGDSYGYKKDSWSSAVSSLLIADDPIVKFKIQPIAYDTASREIEFKVKTTFLTETEGNFYIFACVMEDSIVGKQKTPEGLVSDYMHRHVLRKAINGSWGEELFNGTTEADFELETEFSTTLDDKFNDKQCYVIAYVYDYNDKHIIQAAERKIIK